MSDKSKAMPMLGALVVVVLGLAIGYWVLSGPDTAPSNPPDRTNQEESLPAQPADPAPSPTEQQPQWIVGSPMPIGDNNKKGRGEIAPTFLIVTLSTCASTSVVKSAG
jgi:hypothetical protein